MLSFIIYFLYLSKKNIKKVIVRMDPLDLLHTNNYLPSLENLNNIRKKTEKDELKNYLKNQLFKKPTIIPRNSAEYSDDFSVTKQTISNPTLMTNQKFKNISLSSSIQPVFDKQNNIRYRKEISSYINVDSRQRDTEKYPNPCEYSLDLNKEFRYLHSIHLSSIEFSEPPTPINNTNDTFIWTTDYTGIMDVPDGTKITYMTKIPNAYYTLSNLVQILENTALNTVRHNIPISYLDEQFPQFKIFINPFNRSIQFIQRIDELDVNSIQTFVNTNKIQIRIDNSLKCCNKVDTCDCKDSCAGNTEPFFPDLEDVPIILSGLNFFKTSFGNIPTSLLNLKPFYPEIVVNSNSTLYNKYKYVGYDTKCCEYIYELEVYTRDGKPAIAHKTTKTCLKTSQLHIQTGGHEKIVTVGRSLKFEVVTDEGGSFGDYLGLTTENKNVFIHNNFDTNSHLIVRNKIPWKIVGDSKIALSPEPYIFMRIETKAKPIGTISNNLTNAKGSNINTEIEEMKKDNYFFAKIIFSNTLPGDVSVVSIGGNKFFFDAPLVKLSELSVNFFTQSGEQLFVNQNHSFTLEIIELQEVLKNTLMDSRTGNIANIGEGRSVNVV